MRLLLILLAIVGFTASTLALREHYRADENSPCSINERWDCGIVNKSPFAMIGPVPVAVIGMAGYVFLAALALKRAYGLFFAAAVLGLGFSLYLAHVEAHILGVWCVYCVASLVTISLLTLLSLGASVATRTRKAVS
jgi:uncharacterized membrane protein